MMNKIYHFGDSYGGVVAEGSKHFVHLISEKLGYRYEIIPLAEVLMK